MSARNKEKKQEEIVVVRDFLNVFVDDLFGILPIRKIDFWISLVPRAMSVAKYPYLLEPSELEELSCQLKELQDKGHVIIGDGIHVDPSKIEVVKNRKDPRNLSEVRLFLGLVGYYCRFIGDFSKIAKALTILTQKSKTYDWGEEQENAFQTLKDKLLGLGCVLMQRELFSNYDCEIHNHPGKANVMTDALSKKERVKPKRVRAMNMTLQSNDNDTILAAQKEAFGADKMYYDLRDRYWWSGMKKDIAVYDYKIERLARLYLNEIVARHGVPISIISDRDSRFTSRFWQSMQKALETCLDMSMAYHPQTDGQIKFLSNNSYHSSVRCALFNALYGRKCRSLIMWDELREGQLIGPELVYADERRKPLEFSIGEYVLLKVSPWKGVVRFGKNTTRKSGISNECFHRYSVTKAHQRRNGDGYIPS
nr:putative reverse transcriptase domain-containing protein [Tanacetum cinerariifolium]